MKMFNGKLAVITGGGAGIGRELARLLAKEGCHLALCDVSQENMMKTKRLCETEGRGGLVISTHVCDVSDESQVLAFAEGMKNAHDTEVINLLFNNAGIVAGGSFIKDTRSDWERTFNICWNGVYFSTRAFLPMLIAADEGYIVNMSSVCGFWATAGGAPHTAYSTAKFAIKGFSEALVTDLRMHAPHIKVSVVMPGFIGTDIFKNSSHIVRLGHPDHIQISDAKVARRQFRNLGIPVDDMTDEQFLTLLVKFQRAYVEDAPMTPVEAAGIILDGVRKGQWRILVGEDARLLDQQVRENPEHAYESDFLEKAYETGAWVAVMP